MKTRFFGWAAGLGALMVAGWAGIHAAHLLDGGGGQHGGELAALAVVAVVLLVVSRAEMGTRTKRGD